MTHECRKLAETFLHAYVDGEFSAEESAEVQAHLAACEICAHAVRLHQSYKAAMLRANVAAPHLAYESVREHLLDEPVPGRWARAFQRPSAIAIAAACAGAAIWFLAGGLSHPLLSPHTFIDDGVALHARALPLDYSASDPRSAQQWL